MGCKFKKLKNLQNVTILLIFYLYDIVFIDFCSSWKLKVKFKTIELTTVLYTRNYIFQRKIKDLN